MLRVHAPAAHPSLHRPLAAQAAGVRRVAHRHAALHVHEATTVGQAHALAPDHERGRPPRQEGKPTLPLSLGVPLLAFLRVTLFHGPMAMILLVIAFFVLVASLFPMGVGADPQLLARFTAQGFVAGLEPPRRSLGGLHDLTGMLLRAFGPLPQERED